ncbi:MAG: hypothetical protein U5R31_00460, partial [Acidimicrobiia bacterium]|nr:hypothetical protein [Acidimicrobiia bacterium]
MPDHEVATIRSVQLVGLTPRVALLVVVLSDGAVEKRTVELDEDVDEARVGAAGVRLASAWVGHTVTQPPDPGSAGDPVIDLLTGRAAEALRIPPDHGEQLYVEGASRHGVVVQAPIERVRHEVLHIEEQPSCVG